jgi:hypothetical protein
MNFKTVIDKIVEGGKLILAQPTFMFKDKKNVPYSEYIVKDTDIGRIDLIAEEQYGSNTDIEYILKFNGISDPFSINEGDVLKIPVDGSTIKKLERPAVAISNIVRQEFIEGKKLTKKDKRRIDFLKKKYNLKEVLPPNMLKSGFKNFELKKENGEDVIKMGMGTSTPETSFSAPKNKSKKISVNESEAESISKKIESGANEELTDAEIAKLENSGIKSSNISKKASKLATTFDGKEIGNRGNTSSNFTANMSDALDDDGNKVGNQSITQSEQIEGDKVTKTITKTIVKPDGSSETTQTVTFSKYESK